MREKNPSYANPEAVKTLQNIEKFTKLMDSQFQIPGTKFRFGIDPVLGLIPFAGDAVSLGLQGVLVAAMARHGASNKVITLMALNVLIDFVVGNIPILGAIFDFWFKSSQRNLKLLKQHYGEGRHQGSGKGILIAILIAFLIVLVLVGWLIVELLKWFFGLF